MGIGGVLSAVEIGHCSRKHELSRTKIAQEMCEGAMDIAPYDEEIHWKWMFEGKPETMDRRTMAMRCLP